MEWIDKGYNLAWDKTPPVARELKNSESSKDNHEFITKALVDMLKVGTASLLPTGVRPTDVSPLGVVSKPHTDKLRLIINMRYVNEHLAKRVFKLEGLSNITDMAEARDYCMSYDITSDYTHVALHPDLTRFMGFKWMGR